MLPRLADNDERMSPSDGERVRAVIQALMLGKIDVEASPDTISRVGTGPTSRYL